LSIKYEEKAKLTGQKLISRYPQTKEAEKISSKLEKLTKFI